MIRIHSVMNEVKNSEPSLTEKDRCGTWQYAWPDT